MSMSPTDASTAANALRSYLPLGVVLSDQAAFMANVMGKQRMILRVPIGVFPIGDIREHTEIRSRTEGFGIFRGAGPNRRVLLSATVSNDSFEVIGGELKDYVDQV